MIGEFAASALFGLHQYLYASITRFTVSSDAAKTSRLTEPSASRIACGGFLVVANASAVDTAIFSRISAAATLSLRASSGRGSHRKYDARCPMASNRSRTLRARVCLRRASTRFSVSRRATVPSLSQPVAIAVIRAGVFQVVAWMARSKASMNCVGRARIRSADQSQRSWTGQRRRSSTPA